MTHSELHPFHTKYTFGHAAGEQVLSSDFLLKVGTTENDIMITKEFVSGYVAGLRKFFINHGIDTTGTSIQFGDKSLHLWSAFRESQDFRTGYMNGLLSYIHSSAGSDVKRIGIKAKGTNKVWYEENSLEHLEGYKFGTFLHYLKTLDLKPLSEETKTRLREWPVFFDYYNGFERTNIVGLQSDHYIAGLQARQQHDRLNPKNTDIMKKISDVLGEDPSSPAAAGSEE